jgi:ATP phosphoribosyltransferase
MTVMPTSEKLTLAVPSKGRLMDDSLAVLERGGLKVVKAASARDYRGSVVGRPDIEVQFVSAAEIAQRLRNGEAHLGITGEDLMREATVETEQRVSFLAKLGFGHADVVVAVPACWLDVRTLADLEPMAMRFRRRHGHRVRVATKYLNLTRHYLARAGVTSYRIVESHGATEGTPAAGLAEIVVDITTTGETLRANGLRVLADGVLLKSEANLIASKAANWSPALDAAAAALAKSVQR